MNSIYINLIFIAVLVSAYLGIKYLKFFAALETISPSRKDYFTFRRLLEKFSINKKKSLACFWSIIFIISVFSIKNIFFSIFVSSFFVIIMWDCLVMVDKKKKEKIHVQLIELLMNMMIMLRAGRTIRDIFIRSTKFTEEPLKKFLKDIVAKIQLKSSLEEALEDFCTSSGSKEVRLFVTAIRINNKIGGDIIEVLNNIIITLKDSLESSSRLKTATIQSRFTGNIISFFPIIIFILILLFTKNSLYDFFSTGFGNFIMIAGSILEIFGLFLIKKIINEY
jgi:tight adherence protein B